MARKTAEERFWIKVNKNGPIHKYRPRLGKCWEWIATLKKNGYGRIFFMGKFEHAHRASWKINRGQIAVGMNVLHTCDNRKCIRPTHLFVGTQGENIRDCVKKGRHFTPFRKETN